MSFGYPYSVSLAQHRKQVWLADVSGFGGVGYSITDDVKQWLSENCRFYISDAFRGNIYFFRNSDAVAFKLRWS